MKASELLRAAKQHLRSGGNIAELGKAVGVCGALSKAAKATPEGDQRGAAWSACMRAKRHVNASLNGTLWAERWLNKNHNVPWDEMETEKGRPSQKMQQWRLAWMEHMAVEFEAQGD